MNHQQDTSEHNAAATPAELDGRWLLHCWHGAAAALLHARGRLDDANVFPVADGDTGTNMAATLADAVAACAPERHAGRLLSQLAEASLAASRGNSGIILAQFLGGLAAAVPTVEQLSTAALAAAAGHGVRSARSAVANPVEGTVLTVMEAWATALAAADQGAPVPAALARALRAADAALAKTPAQLGVLADAGVVDAGADGFVCLLRGFAAALQTAPSADDALPDADAPSHPPGSEHHPAHPSGPPNFRWCTEILLEDTAVAAERLRAELADLGDSLITAGQAPRLKVHLHTDQPDIAAARLRAHGRLGPQKVEDMRLQYAAHHAPAAAVGLVTDSGCDLPQSLRDSFQIHQVPLTIQWGAHQYIDGRTLTAAELYRLLGELPEHPTTSQPPPARFERLYGDLLGSHESLVSLHISSRLSGTLGAARLAAERAGADRVHCIDTRQLSVGVGLIVLGTAEALADGADAAMAAEVAAELTARTRIFVVVPRVTAMVRSGRVRPEVGRLARLSGLKPLVSINPEGRSSVRGAAFSVAGLERQLLHGLRRERRQRAPSRWAVAHAAAPAAAGRLAEQAAAVLGSEPVYVTETSPMLGVHAGVGSVALAVTWA
jgi:DegV family protein with EDD domain